MQLRARSPRGASATLTPTALHMGVPAETGLSSPHSSVVPLDKAATQRQQRPQPAVWATLRLIVPRMVARGGPEVMLSAAMVAAQPQLRARQRSAALRQPL